MDPDPIEITEAERPLRTEQPVHLQSEVWHLMHRQARAMQAAREKAGHREADERERFRAHVVDLSRAHYQLTVFLQRHTALLEKAGLREQAEILTTIQDRYAQVLDRAGATLVYVEAGRPFTFEVASLVKIMGWIPTEGVDQPQVLETVNPGVMLDSELICSPEVEVAAPVTGRREEQGPPEPRTTGSDR